MEQGITGTICPFCGKAIQDSDKVIVCPSCATPHHADCWNQGKGCAVPSCSQHQGPGADGVCASCGGRLEPGQAFCPKCGAPRDAAASPKACSSCGAPLAPGQTFCAKCGRPVGAPAQNAGPAPGRPVTPKGKGAPKFIIIAVAVVVVIAAVIFLMTQKDAPAQASGPDFQKLYDEYCSSTWAEVGDDGSYLYIDTNPDDNEDDGLAYVEAYSAVKDVNDALELPDSLLSDMEETTGADGKQTEDFDQVTVSWRYHPDKGLEVTYKKAN